MGAILETHSVIVVGTKTTVKKEKKTDALRLRDSARKFYGEMQTSWLLFAKAIMEIRDSRAYKDFDKKSFQQFCIDEYPSMHFTTIMKTIKVAELWGKDLEMKLEKDEAYQLPAYESCYTLLNAKDDIPSPEFQRLRKNILEGKLSYYALRDKLKDVVTAKKRRKVEFKSEEQIEEELAASLKEEFGEEEFEILEDDVSPGGEVEKSKALCVQLKSRVDYISDNLPTLLGLIETNPDLLTTDIVELARSVEDLASKSDNFLTSLEKL